MERLQTNLHFLHIGPMIFTLINMTIITVAVVDSILNLLRIYIIIYAMVFECMLYVSSLANANTLNYSAVTLDGDHPRLYGDQKM